MALPTLVTNVLDNHGESLQQLAQLAHLKLGEDAKPFRLAITSATLWHEVYKTFRQEDERLEAARQETTLAIAGWVKAHPRAAQSELQAEVQKQVELFKIKIKNM